MWNFNNQSMVSSWWVQVNNFQKGSFVIILSKYLTDFLKGDCHVNSQNAMVIKRVAFEND